MIFFGTVEKVDSKQLILNLDELSQKELYLLKQNIGSTAEFSFDDGRSITKSQRSKAYSMINEVDAWSGNGDVQRTKVDLKRQYAIDREVCEPFSLSNCSVSRANDFIDYLIEFCLSNHIEFASKKLDEIKGCFGWEYHCLENHVCCICGKPAQYAHWYTVGIGRNRRKINHVGNRIMSLCAIHHHMQHSIGLMTFIRKFKLKGVEYKRDDKLYKKLNLERQNKVQATQEINPYIFERQKAINMYGGLNTKGSD